MAKDRSSKGSSKSKGHPPTQVVPGDRPGPTEPGRAKATPSTSRRKGFLGFFRSDKSKSSKKVVTEQQESESEIPGNDATSDNNNLRRASSFSEAESTSKQEQPKVKVKRHLSVSRSGKMKEVKKRTSLAELNKRFENQAQV